MMILYRVEIAPPPSLAPQDPIFVDTIRPGPAIRTPFEGDRFTVTDDWGREHRGVIAMIDDLGVGHAADVLGSDQAAALRISEIRVLHLQIDPHRSLMVATR